MPHIASIISADLEPIPSLRIWMRERYERSLKFVDDTMANPHPAVASLNNAELTRQSCCLNLIASESLISEAILGSFALLCVNQTIEGPPGRRWFPAAAAIDKLENDTASLAQSLFQMPFASVQPHSATQANQAAMLSVLRPGDSILVFDFASGGHISHGFGSSLAARLYEIHTYCTTPAGELDYEGILTAAKQVRPRLLISGSSSYPRAFDFERFSSICEEVECMHLADISHIAGLVCTGNHPIASSADFVSVSLHKTMCGPRGGIVLAQSAHKIALQRAVFPGAQGAPMPNLLAAKAICLQHATTAAFAALQKNIVRNAKALATSLRNLCTRANATQFRKYRAR